MVVEDVEDNIIGGVEEVTDVNGSTTIQQHYVLYPLLTECADMPQKSIGINIHLQVVFKGG